MTDRAADAASPGAPPAVRPGRKPATKSVHLSLSERAARGKAERTRVPLDDLRVYEPAADRPDPVDLLERQAASRVRELIPVRYGRMLTSPFAFFRGAAMLMASDIASTPTTSLRAQLCGDAHIGNFGVFASPERHLVFDVNDFDETLPGPFCWDIKRLVASVAVAADAREFSPKRSRKIAVAVTAAYRTSIRSYAGMRDLDVWYSSIRAGDLLKEISRSLKPRLAAQAEEIVAKARTRDSTHALKRLTTVVDGKRRIISDPPLIVPVEELMPTADVDKLYAELDRLLRAYARSLPDDRRRLLERFRLEHAARKVVGVGSVGTQAWVTYLTGRDGDDPLFLQVKEAQASVLEDYCGRTVYANNGQRVVEGQRLMQAASDIFLGWHYLPTRDGGRQDHYVRQLRDWKGSVDLNTVSPEGLQFYAGLCAETLARAHARSGDRVALAAYMGGSDRFDQAVADFAMAYTQQNARDYDTLRAAVADGKVSASTGT